MIDHSGAAPQRLPPTITANGVTRYLTVHMRNKGIEGITESEVIHVLENWTIRGICTSKSGDETHSYWAFLPGKTELMMRVVVSLDDCEIITATLDGGAAARLGADGRPWFRRRCRNLEVRDGS